MGSHYISEHFQKNLAEIEEQLRVLFIYTVTAFTLSIVLLMVTAVVNLAYLLILDLGTPHVGSNRRMRVLEF